MASYKKTSSERKGDGGRSRKGGRGRSRSRRTVEDEMFLVSNPNRCVSKTQWNNAKHSMR